MKEELKKTRDETIKLLIIADSYRAMESILMEYEDVLNDLRLESLKRLSGCGCVDVEIQMYQNQVVLPRPEFMKAEGNERDICVDTCIASEVQRLWRQEIWTTGCCCGHGTHNPYISVIEEHISKMKQLGYEVTLNTCRPDDEDSFSPKSIHCVKRLSGKGEIVDFDISDMKWVNSDDDMKPFHTQKVWVWILLLTKPLAAEYNNDKFIGEDGELTGVFKWQPALIPFGPDVRMSMLQHTEYRKKFNRKPSWDNNRLLFKSSPRITPDIEEWRNKEKEILHKWQDHEYVELELMALLKKVLESFPTSKPK